MKTQQSRRDFLRLSLGGAMGAMLISKSRISELTKSFTDSGIADPKSFGIGLQLYTIRDAMENDVPGSLKKVSDIGYRYLELAGYNNGKFYGLEPLEFKKMAEDLGMEIISSHAGIPKDASEDQIKKIAEDHSKVGAKYCIQPYVGEKDRTIPTYEKMVTDWNMAGKIMKSSGIRFGYHNHNFEFDRIDGKIPYFDIFLPNLDKDLVIMELDLFWATKAGQSPIDLFRKYPGRFELFHLKDMYTEEAPFYKMGSKDFAPVGEGLIKFRDILASKKTAGMKYMFVEQDMTKDNKPFDAIKTSMTNLITKILVK
jgi:sugar phosphate isomerase/epimerase